MNRWPHAVGYCGYIKAVIIWKSTKQNTLYPAGTHLEEYWECVCPVGTASLNNCHLDVTRQDRKGLTGKIWAWSGMVWNTFYFLPNVYLSFPVVGFFSCISLGFKLLYIVCNLYYAIHFYNELHQHWLQHKLTHWQVWLNPKEDWDMHQ